MIVMVLNGINCHPLVSNINLEYRFIFFTNFNVNCHDKEWLDTVATEE